MLPLSPNEVLLVNAAYFTPGEDEISSHGFQDGPLFLLIAQSHGFIRIPQRFSPDRRVPVNPPRDVSPLFSSQTPGVQDRIPARPTKPTDSPPFDRTGNRVFSSPRDGLLL